MKIKNYLKILVISNLYIFLLITSGCLANSGSSTQGIVQETTFEIPTPSSISISNVTPTTTLITPTITVSLDSLPTFTLQPTLTGEKSENLVRDLLSNNGNCQFPCIWGIIPGETGLNSMYAFFNQFGNIVGEEERFVELNHFKNVGGMALLMRRGGIRTDVDLDYFLDKNTLKYLSLSFHQYRIQGEGMEKEYLDIFGHQSYGEMFQYYQLSQILTTYGPPSTVLINFWEEEMYLTPPTWFPFSLVLFYPKLGFLVEYISPLEQKEDMYVSCPSEAQIDVVSWDPDSDVLLVEIVAHKIRFEIINVNNVAGFKQIEVATTLTLDDFYQIFRNPNNTSCIETPISIWP